MTSLQILQVEDQEDIREIVAISLGSDPGIQLTSVGSGAEALEILAGDLRPDVILLDVMMPEMDGLETLSRLRKLPGHAETPVVFMTARTMEHERTRYLELGALGTIPKPFDPTSLAKCVREILSQSAA